MFSLIPAEKPGDETYVLRWLLERQIEGVATAFFYEPEVVRTARCGIEAPIFGCGLAGSWRQGRAILWT